jgi:hypothetical protein
LRRELEKYKDIPDAPIDESAGLPPELSTSEAVGEFAYGVATGLAAGIGVDFGIGLAAGVLGVSAGAVALALGAVALPVAAYTIYSHWGDITATANRLWQGTGTAEDYNAAGAVVGGVLSLGASKPASALGEAAGGAIRTEVKALATAGPKLAPLGPALDNAAANAASQTTGGAARGAADKVPKRDPFKGHDPNKTVEELLKGTGQIPALIRNTHLKGVDVASLLKMRLHEVKSQLTKEQFKTFMKHFEGRDLRHGR